MKTKRLLTVIGSVCLSLILVALLLPACAPEEVAELEAEIAALEAEIAALEAEPETWHGIHNSSVYPGDTFQIWEDELYAIWELVTDGRVTVDTHWAGELYSQPACFDAMSMGEVQLGALGESELLQMWDQRWGLFSLPLLFDSLEHCKRFMLEAPEFEALVEDLEQFNFLSFGPRSYPLDVFPYMLYTNFPIRTMEDLAGKRLRAAEDPITVRFYELLGAQPMAIAFEELSTANATGMIDGLQTSPPETWLIAAGVWDYQSYQLSNALWWNPCPMFIAKGWWESIDEDLRLKMEAVIPYWAESMYLEFLSARERCHALTEEVFGGPEYTTTLSDAELARWRDVLSPLFEEVFAIEGTQELYDAIQRYR